MLNYIKSELYRTKYRKNSYIFILICSILAILGSVGLLRMREYEHFYMDIVIEMCIQAFSIIYFFTLLIVDNVFSEEYKHHTLKNTVASGISRSKIYLGKFITEIIYAIISFTIIVLVLLLSSYLILGADVGIGNILKDFGLRIVMAFPIWVAGISIANCLAFIVKNNTFFAVCFMLLMFVPSKTIAIVSLFKPWVAKLTNWLPSTYVSDLIVNNGFSVELLGKCYGIAILYIILSIVIGMSIFNRREIK